MGVCVMPAAIYFSKSIVGVAGRDDAKTAQRTAGRCYFGLVRAEWAMVVGQEPVPFFGKSKPDIYACLDSTGKRTNDERYDCLASHPSGQWPGSWRWLAEGDFWSARGWSTSSEATVTYHRIRLADSTRLPKSQHCLPSAIISHT